MVRFGLPVSLKYCYILNKKRFEYLNIELGAKNILLLCIIWVNQFKNEMDLCAYFYVKTDDWIAMLPAAIWAWFEYR